MKHSIRPISAEETFRKLKHKVDFREACSIYSKIQVALGPSVSKETVNTVAEPALIEVGWTLDELWDESLLQQKLREYESKYG